MKQLVTLGLVLSLLLGSVRLEAQPSKNKDPSWIAACAVAAICVYGGYKLVVKIIIPMCERINSNAYWRMTNLTGGILLVAPTTGNPTVLQSATGLGEAFWDGYAFYVQLVNGDTVVVVASREGVPVLTNSVVLGTNLYVELDFRSLPPIQTNGPAGVFRLRQ